MPRLQIASVCFLLNYTRSQCWPQNPESSSCSPDFALAQLQLAALCSVTKGIINFHTILDPNLVIAESTPPGLVTVISISVFVRACTAALAKTALESPRTLVSKSIKSKLQRKNKNSAHPRSTTKGYRCTTRAETQNDTMPGYCYSRQTTYSTTQTADPSYWRNIYSRETSRP